MMSIASHFPPIPPPILIEPPVPATPTDQTTLAVLRYLATMRAQVTCAEDLKEQTDALEHLVRICQCFCRGLYLWNGSQGVNEVQWAESQGRGRDVVVREWIEDWILAQLAQCDRTDDEIQAAAIRDEFRWLGVHCRQALIKEIRDRTPKDGLFPRVAVSLSHSYDDDDPDTDLLSDFVTGPALNLDDTRDPGDPLRVVEDNRPEFERLGVYEVLHELVRGRSLENDETSRVAAKLGLGERQARNRIAECREIMKVAADSGCVGRRTLPWEIREQIEVHESGVKKLFRALSYASNHTRHELGIAESPDSRSRRQLLSEAAKDLWDGISARGVWELQIEEQSADRHEATPPRAARRASMVDAMEGEVVI
jgi:hypothetical protein